MDFPNNLFKNRPSPTVKSNTPVVITESRSLITRTRRLPGQRWEMDLTGFVLPQDNNEFSAFLFGLEGPTATFNYSLISFGKSSASDKTVNTDRSIGDSVISMSNSDNINVGEFLSFTNHAKVYQVHAVNGTNVRIFPNLQRSITSGEVVNLSDVKFRMRLVSTVQSFNADTVRDKVIYSFQMIEAL